MDVFCIFYICFFIFNYELLNTSNLIGCVTCDLIYKKFINMLIFYIILNKFAFTTFLRGKVG